MPDLRISELPLRTATAATDEVPTVAGGVNYRSPLSSIGAGGYVDATRFGVVSDGDGLGGGTDNAEALFELNRYCAANPGTHVRFPPGILCTTKTSWMLNVKSVYLDFIGCTLQCTTPTVGVEMFPLQLGNSVFINRKIGEVENGRVGPDAIDSVAAGTSTVRCKTFGNAAKHPIGSYSLICGYDQQGLGFPYNYRYFEYLRVVARDVDLGTITFERPLRYSYNENWFAITEATGLVGPAGVLPLDRGEDYQIIEEAEVRNLRVLRNPNDLVVHGVVDGVDTYRSDKFTVFGCLSFRGYNISCDEAHCGEGYSFLFEDCHFPNYEPDKIAHSLTFRRGSVIDMNQATGFNYVELDRVRIRGRDSLTPRNMHVHDCHYTHSTDLPIALSDASRSMESRTLENCQFEYSALSSLLPGANNVSDATRPDRPGPLSFSVLGVPAAGQFTVLFTGSVGDGNLTDGRLRIYLAAGTVLKRPGDGARFVVNDIAYDAAAPAKFIVSYASTDEVAVNDVLYFHAVGRLVVHGCRRTHYNKLPWHANMMPAETYINTSDRIDDHSVDIVYQDFPVSPSGAPGTVYHSFEVDGFLNEVDVIVRKPYTGDGDGIVRLNASSPFGTTLTVQVNTKTTGRRRMTADATPTGAVAGDTLTPFGSLFYVGTLRVMVNATDNTGTIGWKGSFRIKATRR
jgi:hypothetical protein